MLASAGTPETVVLQTTLPPGSLKFCLLNAMHAAAVTPTTINKKDDISRAWQPQECKQQQEWKQQQDRQ
jgi:hypothetical protein